MQHFFWIILAFIGGSGLVFQAGINSQLVGLWGKNIVLVACISFFVGFVALLSLVLMMRIPIPELANTKTSWWHWCGGMFGAYLVALTAFLAPRLGASVLFGSILVGQMVAMVLLEHYGVGGYPERQISWQRLFGVGFLFAGVLLIRRF